MYLLETLKKTLETVTGIGRPSARAVREAVHERKAHETMFRDDGTIPNNPVAAPWGFPIPAIPQRHSRNCSSAMAGETPGATTSMITCITIRAPMKCSALRAD